MKIAALITWVLTAGGGFFLLATWISKGGVRQSATSRFPPALIFGHFALAATGLVVWIIYVINDSTTLAWIAFVDLLVVAGLGDLLVYRWFNDRRAVPRPDAATAGGSTSAATPVATRELAEQQIRSR
jgi:hypothetical protein